VLADCVAEETADAVDRLEQAGAVLLGKSNLHEFAYGATGENAHFGTVPNPYDERRLAGGSSSGSAAAVACGLAAAALGTDTGGSVRVPAALCGLVGLKPTAGRVSTRGVIPYSWSLDHVGLLTRSSLDAALLLGAVAGYDSRDPASAQVAVPDYGKALGQDIRGCRIGIPHRFYFEHADPEILAAADRALGLLERLGARLSEIELPSMEDVRTVSLLIQMPEALSYHSRYLPDKAELYGADFRSGLALGQFVLAENYVRARRMVERYRQEMAAVFEEVDAIVTPTCPLVAPEIGTTVAALGAGEEAIGNALTRFTTFFNMTGHPALSTPNGLHSSGLPMGLQVVGRHFDEATVLRLGHALEASRECAVPRPVLDGMSGPCRAERCNDAVRPC
jgi:aspartyl-tRNA(Asn)/glutamyl-tRNA(Gln) amidotransferase subunit A